ncbi:MAG: gliding motility protein GldM [Bacteroidota bacterium]|jgi:gliding motility-associated protein GldM
MAGSSLSPRQKMINMMYLVLTAMLALNVSAEILQAFESLRASLRETAGAHGTQNQSLTSDILNTIEKQEGSGITKYSAFKPTLSEINTEATKVISYIDAVTAELEEIGQKDPITGEIRKKDETTKNYSFWLGTDDVGNSGHGNGKAVELRAKLESFVKWANALYAKQDPKHEQNHFSMLALDPANDPTVSDASSKNKTWEYFTFHGKPVIADMALMEKFKMDVRDVQGGLLHQTKELVKGFTFTVDSLIAFEAPTSEYVAAGMKYQTRLAVGVASKSIKPEFVGSGLSMDPGGSTATMTIAANGNVIPEGQSEGIQHYTAMIKVPNAAGEIVEIPVKGQFKVRKPEVVVRSKALQILYKDCGNTVDVDVPALGESYNPDFSKSTGGGNILKSSKSKREITIVPTGKDYTLSIYSNTNGQSVKIDNLKYNVLKPSQPRIGLFINGQEVNGMSGVNKKQTVTVKLIPDGEFAKTLPLDARYKAKSVKLMYQEGMIGVPKVIKTYSGAEIQRGVPVELYQGELKTAYPGSRIYFEVEEVERINFQKKEIKEEMPRVMLVIPATIKG